MAMPRKLVIKLFRQPLISDHSKLLNNHNSIFLDLPKLDFSADICKYNDKCILFIAFQTKALNVINYLKMQRNVMERWFLGGGPHTS